MNPREQFSPQRNESDPHQERYDDMEFYKEYQDPGKILDAVARLQIIKDLWMAGNNGNPLRPLLEYRESHPSPHGVTMGIEVELPEESVLGEETKEMNRGQKKKYLFELKEKYRETEKIGIPRGEDQFWEFAQIPAHNPETLAREAQALIGMGLINPEYQKFPLHVTIGGISFSSKNDDGANVLARVLEATGWATTGERLMAPYTDPDSNWTSHDLPSGIRERGKNRLAQPMEGETTTAVEHRTLVLRSLFGLDRYLHSAYYLASALRAYQEQKKDDWIGKQLSKIWRVFAGKCEARFEEEELTSPSELWTLNTENPDENSSFKRLAKVLDKAESDPSGREAKFVHDIRQLIISTRAEIKEIIEMDRK